MRARFDTLSAGCREQVIERTRVEREQRQRQRLENRSATCIQVGIDDCCCSSCTFVGITQVTTELPVECGEVSRSALPLPF